MAELEELAQPAPPSGFATWYAADLERDSDSYDRERFRRALVKLIREDDDFVDKVFRVCVAARLLNMCKTRFTTRTVVNEERALMGGVPVWQRAASGAVWTETLRLARIRALSPPHLVLQPTTAAAVARVLRDAPIPVALALDVGALEGFTAALLLETCPTAVVHSFDRTAAALERVRVNCGASDSARLVTHAGDAKALLASDPELLALRGTVDVMLVDADKKVGGGGRKGSLGRAPDFPPPRATPNTPAWVCTWLATALLVSFTPCQQCSTFAHTVASSSSTTCAGGAADPAMNGARALPRPWRGSAPSLACTSLCSSAATVWPWRNAHRTSIAAPHQVRQAPAALRFQRGAYHEAR